MIPVYQTRFAAEVGEEAGNCLQACVASVLELELSDVPNFAAHEDWWGRLAWYLAGWDLGAVMVPHPPGELPRASISAPFGTLVLLQGKSPRGEHAHVVLGEVQATEDPPGYRYADLHDPHPSGDFLDGAPRWVTYFLTPNPVRHPPRYASPVKP